jgi:rhodanese-related sulfurtransferase
LIRKPLVRSVTPAITRSMLDSGYQLIDVRYPEEFDDMHIPGARLIPLHKLPDCLGDLDKSQRYIVYCHSGNRSVIAALKLAQEGIEVLSLEGGIRDWPYETKGTSGSRQTPTGAECEMH